MLKLLNRFAWIIAIFCGIAVSGLGYYGDFIFWGFVTIFVVKYLFLSKGFIEERLKYFADKIKEDILKNNEIFSKNTSTNTLEEVEKTNESIALQKDNFQEDYTSENVSDFEGFLQNTEEKPDSTFKTSNISNNNEIKTLKVEEDEIFENKVDAEIEEKVYENNEVEIFFEKLGDWIKEFFSENLIGKIGGILLFLGVLFFLSLIYTAVGPVVKIMIGFAVGFSIYVTGTILIKKSYKNEGMILLGVGILINYLVILSGRYLIGDNANYSDGTVSSGFLTVGITFFLLILNTVFATVTAMVYNSRVLLIFSFIFAYLNPLLIGGSSDNPYTLVGYSMIISLGGLYLSNYRKDFVLLTLSFVLGNFLILVSTSGILEIGFITKVLASSILSLLSIFTVYKNNPKYLTSFFVGTYLFLMFLLFGSGFLKETGSFIISVLSVILFFGFGVFYFLKTSINSILYVLIFPIVLVMGIMGYGNFSFVPLTLAFVVIIYLLGFNFVFKKSTTLFNYLFFIVIGIFILGSNVMYLLQLGFSIKYFGIEGLTMLQLLTFSFTSFLFLITSYYLSSKKDLGYLYAIGTFFSVLILSSVIGNLNYLQNNMVQVSAVTIILFALINWFTPFFNKNLIEEKSNFKSLLIGNILGILFIGFQLYSFGLKYFPGVTTGLAFAGLAIIYFALSYGLINKIGIQNIKEKTTGEHSRNLVYSYLGVSISVFSLAILLVFSGHNEIISTIWLLQATLLYFFFHKTGENKILYAGNVLFLIGTMTLFNLLDVVAQKEFIFLIPFTIIFLSFVANLKFLENILDKNKRVFHDIVHIIGIGVLGFLLVQIIPSTGHGWSTVGISLFIVILSFVYSYFSGIILKNFFFLVFVLFLINQIGDLDGIFYRLDNDNLQSLRILQYLSTILLGLAVYIWSQFNKLASHKYLFKGVYLIYLFIITSMYVYDIFNSPFAITMYWGVLSFIFINYGLSKNLIKFRTIGLYLISITSIKIFFYDVWYGLDNAISRVVVFMIIGALFMYISTSYSKRFGNKLKGEFDLSNLMDKDNDLENPPIPTFPPNGERSSSLKVEKTLNEKVEEIDISDIKQAKISIKGDISFIVKSKNLLKILKYIIDGFDKTEFESNELLSTYNYFIENYQSKLSKNDYEKVTNLFKKFSENGGKVEII